MAEVEIDARVMTPDRHLRIGAEGGKILSVEFDEGSRGR
jgi:hypothetical protein